MKMYTTNEAMRVGRKMHDQLSQMIAWEQGDLSQDETVALFQELIDSGLVWRLQGCYGRQASALVDGGLCHLPSRK